MSIWSKFDSQTEKCYMAMISPKSSLEPWIRGFELFQNGVENQLGEKKISLEELEDLTEWEYDFSGWLEDYLDELDMREKYQELFVSVEYLLNKFDWSHGDYLNLKFIKVQCLRKMGKAKEAYQFGKKWMEKEPNNYQATASQVYTCITLEEFSEAQKLVDQILELSGECTDDNCVIYIAAHTLYETTGDKKNASKLKKKLEIYDKQAQEEFMKELLEEFEEEDELPFF